MGEFQLPIIKSKDDLTKLLNYLYEEGFGYQSDYEYHKRKVDKIINSANKMNISYDSKLTQKLNNMNNYDDIKKEAENYFSGFSSDDKIFELLNKIYLNEDDSARVPYGHPNATEIIQWFEFKKKYNLEESKPGTSCIFYNLDKNILKVRLYDTYNFKELYRYIFGEECNDFDKNSTGKWLDLGKIELKMFSNGYANIKGDIGKFKEYYNKQLASKTYYGITIIKYNNKVNIIKKTDER